MEFIITNGYQKDVEQFDGSARFDFWRDVVSEQYVKLDCDGMNPENIRGFTGSLRGGLGLGPVRFSEVISDPQIAIRSRRQITQANEDDFLISFQIEKECVVSQNGRNAHLKPGSFALYDSSAAYSLTFEQPFHQFVLQMPREVLTRHLLNPEKYTATEISAQSGIGSVVQNFIFSLVKELCSDGDQPNDLIAENLVNLIALSLTSTVMTNELVESDCVKDALMRRIRQFIDSNLFDPGLNNSQIAQSQGISLRYLHKLFQNQEESIHELILRKRLEAAYKLLAESGASRPSVENVALHVGFSGAPHFSRTFKVRFGICPSEVPIKGSE
ncbi:MAG: helix-turn-helix domain-containing protein [Pseudomonadota bacterium]